MKNLLLRFVLILLLISAATGPVYAEDTAAQIRDLFERYMDAWNQGELMTIGGEIYRPPLYIFDAEQTQILPTAEDIAALLTQVRSELDASGFSHSELNDVSVCELGGGLAFASFHYSRYDREGKPMDEAALSSAYIVRRSNDGWHLAAHVMQVQPGTLGCSS